MHVKTVDYTSPTAAKEFVDSLHNTGFVVLSNHPIKPDLANRVYEDWIAFFKSDEKMNYLFNPNVLRQTGFVPFSMAESAKGNPIRDLKEMYDYRDETDLPKNMSRNTQHLFDDMLNLADELLMWMEQGLPDEIATSLSEPLNEMIKGDMSMVRALHYPPLRKNEEEGAIRSAPHQDINMITLLPASTAPGLQVQDNAERWHEVSCDPGTIVINVGDSLQMATKGFYKSTTHQVTNPVGEEALKSRYSLPFFLHARKDVRLSENHTAGSYLTERLIEIGLMPENKAA
jgi:isopenicillin N synthase-like dioxygenase